MPLLKRKEKSRKPSAPPKIAGKSILAASSNKTADQEMGGKSSAHSDKPTPSASKMANTAESQPGHVSADQGQTSIQKVQQIADFASHHPEPKQAENSPLAEATRAPTNDDLSDAVTHIKTAGKSGKLMANEETKRIEERYVVVNKGLLRVPRLTKVSDATLKNCRRIEMLLS